MMLYNSPGYDPTKPFNNAAKWWDVQTSTFHDYTTGQDIHRPFTADEVAKFAELAARDAVVINEVKILAKIDTALAANATYLALTPTAAQTTAQVKSLTRQINGLLRLIGRKLDTVSDS